ncbi:double zinc ribbon domain-containing protein [Methanosarcina sp. UBA289]|uniref:double zinc ribbon domain-containing protein n=1 Tax=Methanosarcina sp. UBA289 TaxID=1915574 RepID=UPI0025DF9591|nr:zinc ribbon domain-containing protein [Methanosarcina sp. UBA289]
MGFFGLFKDVYVWDDIDKPITVVKRVYPKGKSFNFNDEIVIGPTEAAVVVHNGAVKQVFIGQEKVILNSDNVGIIKEITGAISVIDVYMVNTRRFLARYGEKGTFLDPTLKGGDAPVEIGINFDYTFALKPDEISIQTFFSHFGYAGDISQREVEEVLNKNTSSQIKLLLTKELEAKDENGHRRMSVFSIDSHRDRLSNAFAAASDANCVEKFGINIIDYNNFNVRVDPEYVANRKKLQVRQADVDSTNLMAGLDPQAVKNKQMLGQANVLHGIAQGAATGSSGVAGLGAEVAVGLGLLTQSIMQDQQVPNQTPQSTACLNCGGIVPAGSAFCPACGTPAAKTCPSCDKEGPAGALFCPYCGKKMD